MSDTYQAPELVVGATISIDHLPTPAGAQPRAPDGSAGSRLFARLEALQVPAYVAIGYTPDPTREPRILVLPQSRGGNHTALRIGPNESVAAILAEDIEAP